MGENDTLGFSHDKYLLGMYFLLDIDLLFLYFCTGFFPFEILNI